LYSSTPVRVRPCHISAGVKFYVRHATLNDAGGRDMIIQIVAQIATASIRTSTSAFYRHRTGLLVC